VGTRAQYRTQALASRAFKGAGDLTQAGHQQSQSIWHKAITQGQKVFHGAVDYADQHKNQVAIAAATITPFGAALSPDAKKFTEAIPGWIDKHVDLLTKGRAQIVQNAIKPLEHIPVVGKAAQAFAWFDNKMGEFGGGVMKGAGSMVGGVLNIVTHPVETATGLYSMAEHVPFMAGLVPNPLKLAHAGADIIFNGADPKARMETVMDPGKSLQDDAKFGKALVKGFVEPYKKSWAEGKYFEVAGRATFDIGSLFIGAGEANAAIKTGEVASVAGKTAEVASVASKTAEVANVASKTGEVANVASKSGKAAEVASTAGKTTEVANIAGKTEKVAEVTSTAGKATEVAGASSGKGAARTAESSSTVSKSEELLKVNTGGKRGEVPLTDIQKEEMLGYVKKIAPDLPEDRIRFVDQRELNTAYGPNWDLLNIGTDVMPASNAGLGTRAANSRMSWRGALAHELVGHREAALAGKAQAVGALEEAQASIRAARYGSDLSQAERYTLLRDGIMRLHNAGIKVREVKDLLHIHSK
jgi:hypothetical protein